MAENVKLLEENLREFCSLGDVENVEKLISKGVNINSKNEMNGWTALHWAAYRNHKDVVELLLRHGADKWLLTHKGESPSSLTSNQDLQTILGGSPIKIKYDLPITPNYLKHPQLLLERGDIGIKHTLSSLEHELVLKVRIANCSDPDFIEIEIPKTELTFARLVKTCCEELNANPAQIKRIRKLPNTILRKDKDVQRLRDYQEVELVLGSSLSNNCTLLSTTNQNGYESISLKKDQTILY